MSSIFRIFLRRPQSCDIIVEGDYPHVSRMHCMVTYEGAKDAFVVVDSSSTGTLRADRSPLPNGQRANVRRGETLLLADQHCMIKLD